MLKANRQSSLVLLFFILMSLAFPDASLASSPPFLVSDPPPPGFELIASSIGVSLYKKDYPGGNPDYVQVIDLRQGASLTLMYGRIVEPRQGKGVYGGDDPRFQSLSLGQFWQQAKAADSDAFCVTNGQFFYMPESPTRLAFPLKMDGQVITDGWAIRQYPGEKLLLELWGDHVEIVELTDVALHRSQAPDIIAGLTEIANKRLKYAVGRTFIGVDDRDGNNRNETILVFNTLSATQAAAAATLREWGADQVMMLDGGGSTQLICQGVDYIRSERPIPQAIAILAGELQPVAAVVIAQPAWPVVRQEEGLPFEIQLQNTGAETWQAGDVEFIFASDENFSGARVPLAQAVASGETVDLKFAASTFTQAGIVLMEIPWRILRRGDEFPGSPVVFNLVVLPPELSGKRDELQTQINAWQSELSSEVSSRVDAWLVENTGNTLQAKGRELIGDHWTGLLYILGAMVVIGLVAWAMMRSIRKIQ